MPAIALMKFVQGVTIGGDGHALVAQAGTQVDISNVGDNSGVNSWRIELVWGPPGSAFEQVPGTSLLLAESSTGNAVAASITPQAGAYYGCYRIVMSVWAAAAYAGDPDVDIRNIVILTPNQNVVLPPAQFLPKPLPLLGTGETGEKPHELNIDGQLFGWAGDESTSYRLLNASLLYLDGVGGGTTAVHTNVAGEIATVSEKVVPIAADLLLIEDSADANNKKRVQAGNLPVPAHSLGGHTSTTLAVLNALISDATLDDAGAARTDTTAVHDNVAGEIAAVALKATPVPGDLILIEDSADTNNKKRVTLGTLGGVAGGGRASGFTGVESHDSAGVKRIGALVFNGALYTSATFIAVLEASNASYSAIVELYDVVALAVIAASTLTSTSLSPEKLTAALTVPTDLPAVERIYEVHLRMGVANPGDVARCLTAYLEF